MAKKKSGSDAAKAISSEPPRKTAPTPSSAKTPGGRTLASLTEAEWEELTKDMEVIPPSGDVYVLPTDAPLKRRKTT